MKAVLEAIVAEMLEQKVRLGDALQEFEKRFIQTALARSSGNQCKAAQLLHVHRHAKEGRRNGCGVLTLVLTAKQLFELFL